MSSKPVINLPLIETVKRSFLYAFVNLELFIKVSAVWFVLFLYEVFGNFSNLCYLQAGGCEDNTSYRLFSIFMLIASVAIIVSYCRAVILKEQFKFFHFSFGLKELKYLGYSLLLIAVIVLPSVLLMALLGALLSFAGLNSDAYTNFLSLFFSITVILSSVFSTRLTLIFPAVAVENKEVGIMTSYHITAGNTLKLFGGLVIMLLPYFASIVIVSTLYNVFLPESFVAKMIFSFVFLALSFFDACLKASFYSHVYQYFMYFYRKEDEIQK